MPNQVTSKSVDKARRAALSLRPTQEDKIRDNRTALVDGVYMTNHPIRKKMLSYLWGKYKQLPEVITDSLGQLYKAIEKATYSPKNMKNLFDYTHDGSTVYSDYIKSKYLTVGEYNTKEGLENISRGKYIAWHDKEYEGKSYAEQKSLSSTPKSEKIPFLNYKKIDDNDFVVTKVNKLYFNQYLDDDKTNIETVESPQYQDYERKNINVVSFPRNNNRYAWNSSLDKKNAIQHSVHESYNEGDTSNSSKSEEVYNSNDLLFNESFSKIDEDSNSNLINYTNDLFNAHKINTLIGRFHTDESNTVEYIDSAKTRFGNSHGRNLLKRGLYKSGKGDDVNGYDNPYCRVWTYHHQYSKVSDLIRPFGEDSDIYENEMINKYRSNYKSSNNNTLVTNGGEYLKNNTVLNKNGFVNITPTNGEKKIDPKSTMFSIENLAWKDSNRPQFLDNFQKGPNGGRIMWFPPYDINFSENINVTWDAASFIGRGEQIHTYGNTVRRGTLSFTLLIDHPSVLNSMAKNDTIESEDYENEILRFFAGCSTPTEGDKKETNYDVANLEQKVGTPEKLSLNDENCRKIKFYVFFPNNYSGNMNVTTKQNFEANGPSDTDWAKYLFMGHGIKSEKEGNLDINYGFEMNGSNKSISDDVNSDDGIRAWDKKPEKRWVSVSGNDADVRKTYKYRVDFDLRQNGLTIANNYSSYIDEKSYKLNSNLDAVSNQLNDNEVTTTFASVFYTLNQNDEDVKSFVEKNSNLNIEEDNSLKELIDNKANAKINITVYGMATNQDSKNSEDLSVRRAHALNKYLKSIFSNAKITETSYRISNVSQEKDINTIDAKSNRGAMVEISYSLPNIEKQNDNFANNSADNDVQEQDVVRYAVDENKTKDTLDYFDEGEFFNQLEYTDKIAYDKIRQKVKYFAPAYHSITPEGFNSRLNFLHQCTRQGPTIEADSSSNITGTAGNLSFGRPPFCVLRIGDFIHTKMLIESLTINYDKSSGMQWDLNPEGIGVQPMFAKISLGIIIIGGQSLEAPISRLNNAVSFNYYANTGVYDKRADRATYADNGKINYNSIFLTKNNNTSEE